MLVPLIFQRAPYLTAALLTLSQPCLFSSPAAGGGGFPQLQPSLGVGQGWVTQRVSPSCTGAGPLAPACDAHRLPRCSRAHWSCKTPASAPASNWRWAEPSTSCRTLCTGAHCTPARHTPRTGTSHTTHRHIAHWALAHLTPCSGTSHTGTSHAGTSHTAHRHIAHRADTPPHPAELFISPRACLAASSSISKHQAN